MIDYFKNDRDNFKCQCGCGMDVEDKLVERLNVARHEAGVPFNITSGARCLEHNRKIGSRGTSSHVEGIAADIACTPRNFTDIIYGLKKAGFTRIGYNQDKSFIHADLDEDKPQVSFLY